MNAKYLKLVRPSGRSAFFLFILVLLPLMSALAQNGPTPAAAESSDPALDRMVASLAAQLEAIRIKRQDVDELEAEMAAETNEVSREALVSKLQKATQELEELLRKFRETAAGVDLGLFEERPEEPFSWEQKFGEIIKPFLSEIQDATSLSRKMADLRKEEEGFTEQADAADRAVEKIDRILEVAERPQLVEALEKQRELWLERESLARSQAESATLQLENLEAQRKGFLEGSTNYIRNFVQKRGLNLLIGVGAALAVFFAVRFILFVARRLRKTENPKNFGSRVFVLTANLLSVLGGLAAMMAAFSVTGDVFLFSFVLLFLLGVAWGGLKVLPQFVESLKLILNIGMVKEEEKIVFDEVPWKVESLGFTCRLRNPLLDDAEQLLPVRHLVGHHSRPWCEGEEAFPCRRGDWVQLSDGRIGKTVAQNPGHVVLEEWGGARVVLPTPDFLGLAPRRLSGESFRVETRFGIDYKYQKECTTTIPGVMEEAVRRGVVALVGEDRVKDVSVQFASASSSSLDFEVEVDLTGEAAPLYEKVSYTLQKSLVECCNENGWEIPFQQLTVHRA